MSPPTAHRPPPSIRATDNYGNGKTPVFGTVIAAFQGHHSTPWTITHRSFFNNVHKIARSVIPLLMLAMLCTSSPCARLFWVIFLNSQTMSQVCSYASRLYCYMYHT